MRLTLRGKAALALLLLVAAFGLGLATAPYCWNGSGYGRCMDR